MIRVICREVNAGAACNVGGPVDTTWKTFVVNVPELESWLCLRQAYVSREVVGVEIDDTMEEK